MYKRVVTVCIALSLLLAPIAGVVGAGSTTMNHAALQAGPTDDGNELEVYSTGHENVSLWERSVLPLRANLDGASTVIENQQLKFNGPDENEIPAHRQELGVFDAGEVPLTFSAATGANVGEHFDDDQEVTVIVGHLESTASLAELELTTSFDEEELEALNDDVHFTQLDLDDNRLDENGELETTFEAEESGSYVALVATVDDDGDGLTENNGDIEPASKSTIIGLESFLVHDGASVVDTSSLELGEDVTFDVETDLEGEYVSHGIVLYDNDAFMDSETVINLTAEPSTELSPDDVVVEHDLAGLDGAFSIVDDHNDEKYGYMGQRSLEDILERLGLPTDEVETDEADDSEFLNGSVTVLETASADVELTVGTTDEWDADAEYRWIHVATSDAGDIETSTDTMTVDDGDDGGSSPPSFPSPSPPEEPDYRVSDASLSDSKIAPGDSVEVSAKIQNVGEGTGPFTAELLVNGEVVDSQIVRVAPGQKDTVTFTHTFDEAGEYDVAINDADAGTVSVSVAEPASFEVTNAELSATEIELDETVDVSATVTNTGKGTGSFTAELLVDGEVVDEEDVRLFGGDDTSVEFSHSFDEAGEYEIAINDAAAGTVTVTDSDDDDDSIPGFGGLAALAALTSALLGLRYVPARD